MEAILLDEVGGEVIWSLSREIGMWSLGIISLGITSDYL